MKHKINKHVKSAIVSITLVIGVVVAAMGVGTVFVSSCMETFPSLRHNVTWSGLPNTALVCSQNIGKRQLLNCLDKHPEYKSDKLIIGGTAAWRKDGEKCVADYPEIGAQKPDFYKDAASAQP